jgi:lipopolysaccharide transport system permease protein
MELETRVYQKENTASIGKHLKESLKDLFQARFLAKQLATRDIKAQYRQSFFGFTWIIITPLLTSIVWIVLNASGTVKLIDTGIPYPLYAFSGTLIWSIIVESINAPIQSTSAAKSILSKINFPKEGLVLSGIYKLLFNSLIKIALLLVFVWVYKVGFQMSLLLLPLTMFGAILIGSTLGLLLAPIGLLYKDVSKMISLGLKFLMYATPVVYAIPEEGIMKMVMEINPITPIVVTTRDLIVGFEPEYLSYFLILVLVCIPLLFVALVFYRISMPIIVERLSA